MQSKRVSNAQQEIDERKTCEAAVAAMCVWIKIVSHILVTLILIWSARLSSYVLLVNKKKIEDKKIQKRNIHRISFVQIFSVSIHMHTYTLSHSLSVSLSLSSNKSQSCTRVCMPFGCSVHSSVSLLVSFFIRSKHTSSSSSRSRKKKQFSSSLFRVLYTFSSASTSSTSHSIFTQK